MSTKVSTGFGWLEDDTTGDPAGVRRHGDGKEFTIPLVETDPVTTGVKLSSSGAEIDYSFLDVGRRPAPYRQQVGAVKVASACDATGAGNWIAAGNSTVAVDSSKGISGTQAVALTTTSAAGADGKMTKTLAAPVDLSSTSPVAWLRIRFYVDDVNAANTAMISAGLIDANGYSRIYYMWYPAPNGKTGWNEMYLPLSQHSYAGGTLDLAAVTKLYLAVTPVNNTVSTVVFDEIMVFAPKISRTTGRIMVGFDGTYSQQAAAVAYMAKKGLPVALATNGRYLDQAGRLTSAQVKAASKSVAHVIGYAGSILGDGTTLWAGMTSDQKLYVVNEVRKWMLANGYHSGARMLSISGTAGWTAGDDALIGKYLDFATGGDMLGSKYQQLTLESPNASFGWWNGQSTTTRGSMNFTNLCAAANACRGVIVYWAHLNDASNDTVANFTANMDIAIAAGLEFVSPLDFAGIR